MIRTLISSFFFFISSLFILSFNIANKPLFYYFYESVSPITSHIQNNSERIFTNIGDFTKKISTQFFTNSTPQAEQKSKASRLKDQEELDELIKDFQ